MAAPVTMAALVVALAVLGGVGGQCPTPSELRKPNSTRICAELFADNSPYYDQCCAGPVLVAEPDDDVPYMPRGWADRVSSLVVGSRCELLVWSRNGKKGNSKRFKAGAVPRLQEVRRGLFGDWNDAIRGYYCTCN